jgi:hypothetical protein
MRPGAAGEELGGGCGGFAAIDSVTVHPYIITVGFPAMSSFVLYNVLQDQGPNAKDPPWGFSAGRIFAPMPEYKPPHG